MDLELSDEALALQQTFDRLFAKEASLERVRAVEPRGFDPLLWATMVELDVPNLGVAEESGGQGADLRTMAALAESLGRHLAPVPIIESMVANRLLAAVGATGEIERNAHVTVALQPVDNGIARLTPAGAEADHVVVRQGADLLLVDRSPAREAMVLGSMPSADVSVDRATVRCVLASGDAAVAAYSNALDEWRTLTASSLSGLAAEAVRIGVNYASSRHQFGVPIGSFQAVSQAFADHATATQGSRLLAYESAWAADVASLRAPLLSSMAFVFASRTAQRATAHSLHIHGGYGFMLEYDIQMYFRRAKGWPLALGSLPQQVRLLAHRALDQPNGTV